MLLRSCDTFVCTSLATSSSGTQGGTLFGKNADRPSSEEHEVIRTGSRRYNEGDVVRCTYITIPQAKQTFDCVLSKPRWMWGTEIGANALGVCGGNEAVQTLLSEELLNSDGSPTKSLLGMDILRLALERGRTAKEAVEVSITMLEKYGQGGPCCQEDKDWTYENSYIFADSEEAYVLETAGRSHWCWERVGAGQVRNISNGISIRSNWGGISKEIQNISRQNSWWDGVSDFDWKKAVASGGSVVGLQSYGREAAGQGHLKSIKEESDAMENPPTFEHWIKRMIDVLKDEDSGICFRDIHGFCSTGSQISWIESPRKTRHFFTGASDPLSGTPYKLFRFSDSPSDSDHGSNTLWDLWRQRTLSKLSLGDKVKYDLKELEDEGFSEHPSLSFADLISREVELIEKSRHE